MFNNGVIMSFDESLRTARNQFENKNYRNARLLYFRALDQTQDKKAQAIIWSELSWVYYHEGQYQQAVEAAENVLINDPDYRGVSDVYRLQGFSYLAMQNETMAERMLALSLQHDSESDKQNYTKFEMGKLHFKRGSYDLAYPYFESTLEYFEKKQREYLHSTLFYLGFIFYYLQNDRKATELFDRLLRESNDKTRKASALFGLAFVQFRKKDYPRVISLCENIISEDEQFYDKESVAFLTAASYHYLGRKDVFEAYYQQIQAAYPDGRYAKELDRLRSSATN